MGDYSPVKDTLKEFLTSMIDISLNEKSVHYLHSTDVIFHGLYEQFQSIILNENKSFFKKFIETAFKKKNLASIQSLFGEYIQIFDFLPLKTFQDLE